MSEQTFDYLHFRVTPKMREIIDSIAGERGSFIAETCRHLIMTSPDYIANCHPGHPVEEPARAYEQSIPGRNPYNGGHEIVHNLGTQTPVVSVARKNGQPVDFTLTIIDVNTINIRYNDIQPEPGVDCLVRINA